MKKHNKIGIGGNYLHIIKTIYEKPTANILSGERLRGHMQLGCKQVTCSGTGKDAHFHHFYSIQQWTFQPEQLGKKKRHLNWRSKIACLPMIMILHLENPKDSTTALVGVAQWVECCPVNRKVTGSICPSGHMPGLLTGSTVRGVWGDAPKFLSHINISLPCFPPLQKIINEIF